MVRFINMDNPYGAVPNALKEVRLSLSDMLSNIIQGKEMDRRAALDLANASLKKSEMETEMQKFGLEQMTKEKGLELENERFKKNYGLDVDQFKEQQRKTGVEEGLNKDKFNLEKDKFKLDEKEANMRMQKLGIDIQAAREGLTKTRSENKIDTVENHLKNAGFPSWTADFIGIDKNTKVDGKNFAERIKVVGELINKDPVSYQTANVHKLSEDVESIYNQIPKAKTPEERTVLISQFNDTHDRLKRAENIIDMINDPKSEKNIQAYRMEYAKSVPLQDMYRDDKKSYGVDKYLKAVQGNAVTLKKQHNVNIERVKTKLKLGQGEQPKESEWSGHLYDAGGIGIETPKATQPDKSKTLDKTTAETILKEARGNRDRAREIAKSRGYTF
jgi:hypothetical protein